MLATKNKHYNVSQRFERLIDRPTVDDATIVFWARGDRRTLCAVASAGSARRLEEPHPQLVVLLWVIDDRPRHRQFTGVDGRCADAVRQRIVVDPSPCS